MSQIILSTLNARYIHCSLGLRYLKANMEELIAQTSIQEYIINTRPIDIVENLLTHKPEIIGFGVYIWNVEQTTQVISLLKTICPEIIIIIGGPEVSFEHAEQKIVTLADYVISGPADLAFAELCRTLQDPTKTQSPKLIQANPVPLPFLKYPYQYYSNADIKNRVVYIEASRGCPFKCEFCLSSLDKTAWPFDLDSFLQEVENLYLRGVRNFKFIDRTFNLKIKSSVKILEFFLNKNDKDLYLHFELIPDHLPEKLRTVLQRFPSGSLQFEIGIQTFNPEIQILISRKQDNEKSKNNIRWLREHTHSHLHTDIIMGLPGETLESIANSVNNLLDLNPHEIQMGVLKRLRGTPLIRHTKTYDMRYNPEAPYNILSNNTINFETMQRLNRFARYWDIIINSGRFKYSRGLILAENGFHSFLKLSDWIYSETGQTHKIALRKLFELIYQALTTIFTHNKDNLIELLWKDYQTDGLKGFPSFINPEKQKKTITFHRPQSEMPNRQARHAKQAKI